MIVNDRVDLAILSDADGVHLGQTDIPIHEARQLLGPQKLIGVSTHNLAQLQVAQQAGADYIGCGPTFPSTTKDFEDFAGLDFLREAHPHCAVPAFAIGGIQLDNCQQVLATGFSRVALQGYVDSAADPLAAMVQMRERITAALDSTASLR